MQCPHHLILVKPRDFAFNVQTAASNAFQRKQEVIDTGAVAVEFEGVIRLLEDCGINHTVFDSPGGVNVPDAVFPNNWFAVMPDGSLVIFPLLAPNRRSEVNPEVTEFLRSRFVISRVIDLSGYAGEGQFLEGTGSIVFDHRHRLAYACESERTHTGLFEQLCVHTGYTPVSFLALDLQSKPIYHTNVVMSAGTQTVICCTAALADVIEAAMLRESIKKTGKQLLEISYSQMNAFCANVMQVVNREGKSYWLMSSTAFAAFDAEQLGVLEQSGEVVHTAIDTIEKTGGGSLRCMLAGIHAPAK